MTFYALFDSAGVREDTYLWQESDKRFWFAGATLTISPRIKWEPNQISWDWYFIIGCNRGIGVSKNKVSFVEDNKERFVAYTNITQTGKNHHSQFFYESNPSDLARWEPNYWSSWREIMDKLKGEHASGDFQTILFIMEQWEVLSRQTLSQARDSMKNRAEPQDIIEIYVAHPMWLWHNSTKGIVTLGCRNEVWGSVCLHPGNTTISCGALPIYNGWFVGIADHNRYLLLWDGHSIKVQTVVFPRGQWEVLGNGKWKHWIYDSTVLTPENQLVALPYPFSLEEVSREWALCQDMKNFNHIMLVGRRGEMLLFDKSEYGEHPRFCLGKQNALIIHPDNYQQCLFSIARIGTTSGTQQKFHPHWQAIAIPRCYEVRRCIALRDKTDVFVVFFIPSPLLWGFCIIDEQGRFWQPNILFKGANRAFYGSACVEREDGRAVVITPQDPDITETSPIIIEVSNGWGYVKLDAGIAMSGPLVPLPSGGLDLWEHLNRVLDPIRSF